MFLEIAVLIGKLLLYCVLPIVTSLIIKATAKQMEILRCQDDRKLIFEGNQNGTVQRAKYLG